MLQKIIINTSFSLLSAASGLACTIYMAKNLDGIDYSNLSLCILVSNSAALINIFKPNIFFLTKNQEFTQDNINKIFSSSLLLSLATLCVSFLIFYKNNNFTVSIFFAASATLSFCSSIISDDVEASGEVVYSSLIRNLFWIAVYITLFFITLKFKSDFLIKSSIIFFLGNMLLVYFLAIKSNHFTFKKVAFAFNAELLQYIKDNSKISIFNMSALILGSADRTFLSIFAGKTEFFHLYSVISDLFIKSHIFFRVISSVALSTLTSRKISEEQLRRKAVGLLTLLFFGIMILLPAMDVFLALFNINNFTSYKIAIFYSSAMIPVGAGYMAAAIAYSRGDSRSFIKSYLPVSLLFLVATYMVCSLFDYRYIAAIYLLSRIADIILMEKVGFEIKYIFYTTSLSIISLITGWLLWTPPF